MSSSVDQRRAPAGCGQCRDGWDGVHCEAGRPPASEIAHVPPLVVLAAARAPCCRTRPDGGVGVRDRLADARCLAAARQRHRHLPRWPQLDDLRARARPHARGVEHRASATSAARRSCATPSSTAWRWRMPPTWRAATYVDHRNSAGDHLPERLARVNDGSIAGVEPAGRGARHERRRRPVRWSGGSAAVPIGGPCCRPSTTASASASCTSPGRSTTYLGRRVPGRDALTRQGRRRCTVATRPRPRRRHQILQRDDCAVQRHDSDRPGASAARCARAGWRRTDGRCRPD